MALHSSTASSGAASLNGIALCAGVGGLELGVQIAEPNYQTVCYVEREAFAAATLVARMADQAICDAPVWDDLTTFDGKPWRGSVDIITAGYPCQPFSSSGRRKGTKDPRHMWPHVARVARQCRPTWLFLENVLGHIDLGFDVVLRQLRGMGYRVEAGLFSAAEVGASQWRVRLFILAYADSGSAIRKPGGVTSLSSRGRLRGQHRPDRKASGTVREREELDAAVDVGAGAWPETDRDEEHLPIFPPGPFDLTAWQSILARRADLQPCILRMDDGWPIGWTDNTLSVTGLSHWLQRMRGELSKLPSPAVEAS